jgi:gliding motility-associated-like protein
VISTSIDPKVYSLKWNTGETTPTIVVNKSGKYVLTVSGSCGQLEDSVTIQLNKLPQSFSLGNDIFTCEDTPTKLKLPADYQEDIVWDDGSSQSVREVVSSGSYWATATNSCGTVTDTIRVTKMAARFEIPNVITPNGDGRNDLFVIDAPEGVSFSLEVYNRWGLQLFYSSAYDNHWGGMNLSSGTYYYVINSACAATKKETLSIVR